MLDAPYHGTTKPYTLVNGGFGVEVGPARIDHHVDQGVNLANQSVQQHVFGDITKRQIVGEFRVQF